MRRVFPSLQNSAKYAYVYDSDNFTSSAPVHDRMLMYETYGHGMTQHPREWPITKEFVADYLASMATQMFTDGELIDASEYVFLNAPSDEEFAFASSVVWKPCEGATYRENKTRYYNLRERKITTSSSKQYDTRYTEVKSRHDGSPQAVFDMVLPEYSSNFQKYVYAEAQRDWFLKQDNYSKSPHYMPFAAEFIGWFEDDDRRENSRNLREALHACKSLVQAHRLREQAEACIRYLRPKPMEVETTTESETESAA